MRNRSRFLLPAVLAAVTLACGATPGGAARSPLPAQDSGSPEAFAPVELATVGMDTLTRTPVVLLREPDSGQVVPIWVGIAEAQAIARALHGVEVPRPMTHDLMADLVDSLGAEVHEVVVHDLRNGTYFGRIRLVPKGGGDPVDVDSRPSDALALALRTGAAIRVARKILVQPPEFDFMAPEGDDQIARAIGITVVPPRAALRTEFGLPDRPGVVVTTVVGEAQRVGLRRGDFIVKVNDETPASPMDFFEAVRRTPPAVPVRITYWRAGTEYDVELSADVPSPDRPGQPGSPYRV